MVGLPGTTRLSQAGWTATKMSLDQKIHIPFFSRVYELASVPSAAPRGVTNRSPNFSSLKRSAAIQNQEDILVYDLAFSDMFVGNCGVSGLGPIHFLERYFLFYKTKQLQTGDREASGTCLAIERYIGQVWALIVAGCAIIGRRTRLSGGEGKRCVRLHSPLHVHRRMYMPVPP